MQLDVRRWTPELFAVHGREVGSETKAQGKMLQSDVIYLCDRLYDGLSFMQQVFDAGSHVVVRLKKSTTFRVQEQRTLSPKDREAGVVFDEIGQIGKGTQDNYKQAPPERLLRLVTIWDEVDHQQVRLLTDLLDLDAWVIAYLYRCRWIIELFFRWLKTRRGWRIC